MKIACLSGKGGAGKTFVAVNLAAVAPKATYIDCDVEEPNGRLFFKPKSVSFETISSLLPEFDADKCNGCKKCVQFCRFHALMYIKKKPMVFSEVCHSCGGCMMVCPENAITEKEKSVGILETGTSGNVHVISGILNPGEASGIPIIKEALKKASGFTIIDCPPGSACSVMESVMDADFCILVAEPTAFGFHNFKMVHQLVTLLGKKCGVVINKQELAYPLLEDYCKEQKLPILARIGYEPEIGRETAEGNIVSLQNPKIYQLFSELLQKIGGAL